MRRAQRALEQVAVIEAVSANFRKQTCSFEFLRPVELHVIDQALEAVGHATASDAAERDGPRVLAMTFGSYMCAIAGGGRVGMIPGNAHAVGTTTLRASETFRESAAFKDAVRAYGKPMDASGEMLVVHQT